MEKDDFQILALALLAANLVSLFVIGSVLLEEITRRPRVVGIIDGKRPGDGEKRDFSREETARTHEAREGESGERVANIDGGE